MSVFFDLVLNTVCRSNHHRLAIDALALIEGDDAEGWRDLFLQQHPAYLEGAKAPDEVFKDFKNHVLHVRDGYWGGAPEAAEEWYKRTVRALQAKDWRYAAYCAGVMSHYIVDPLQPFHTGQTEEEGLIHRAVEWSLSKSYMELRKILLTDLGGWPDVRLDDGPNWLTQAVRAGADRSNPHYATLIEHYDFNAGRKKPEAGLDQEIKDCVAPLIGYAAALVARVLQRAFKEAAVAPPRVVLVVDTLLTGLNAPVALAAKAISGAQDRAVVAAMHEEFRKIGKVRKTLPEDDKEVRALYAAEVLKTPLSSLDCKWPRETGLAHGTGAPARKTGRKAKVAASRQPALRRTPAELAEDKREAKLAAKAAAKQAPIQAARGAEAAKTSSHNLDAAIPAPVGQAKRIRLRTEDSVVDAPSIGRKTADRLQAVSVRTVADLLKLDPEDAARRIKAGHINAQLIRDWQAQARFACTIPDVTSISAQLLTACGVRDLAALAATDAPKLHAEMVKYSNTEEGERLLRSSRPPEVSVVAGWVNAARGASKRAAA